MVVQNVKQVATIKDISRMAGVSLATVSRSLRDDQSISRATRRRVKEIATSLNYRPNASARALVRHRSENIGWILGKAVSPLDPSAVSILYYTMMAEVHKVLAKEDFNLIVVMDPQFAGGQHKEMPKIIAERHIDGLLVIHELDADLIKSVKEAHIPLVALNALSQPDLLVVSCDEQRGLDLCVDHLRALGHRRIGFVNAAGPGHFTKEVRPVAYQRTMARVGLTPMPGGELYRPYHESVNALVSSPSSATALICFDDVVAWHVMQIIAKKGLRVPQDVSVVGINASYLSELTDPLLTTLRIPSAQIGRLAAQRLIQVIRGETYMAETILIPPELVVQESTSRVKG